MPSGPPPSLANAFNELNIPIKQRVDICASGMIPYAVTNVSKGARQGTWYEPGAIKSKVK